MTRGGIMRVAAMAMVMAAALDPAGAAAPSATMLASSDGRHGAAKAVAVAPGPAKARDTVGSAPLGWARGWLVATAAFGLLGLGMRARPPLAPHAIG